MSNLTKFISLAVGFSILGTPALAQEVPEHGIFILNSLLFLMAGFLAIGLGMLVAPLNCIQRDIEHLFRFIVRAGFLHFEYIFVGSNPDELDEIMVFFFEYFPILLSKLVFKE